VPEGTTAVAQLTANEAVTWSISGGADAGKFSIDASGNLSFDSAPDFEAPTDTDSNNVYLVEVQAEDGSGNVSTQTVTVTVTDVDDTAPQVTPDSETIDEDTPITIDVLANDAAGGSGSLTLVSASVDPSQGTVAIVNNQIVFTPATNFNGVASITYVANNGTQDSEPTLALVTVTPVNDLPAVGNPADSAWDADNGRYRASTQEDTPRSGRIAADDVDGHTLNFSTAQPAHGTVEIDPLTGDWTYTPDANFHGMDAFVVTVSDGHGGSTAVTVAVEVTPVNDAPSFGTLEPTATQFTTSQDSPWSGQLPAATDREGAALTYDLAEGPAHGTVVVDADGHYRYVPAEGFHGSDSFLARVSDGAGGTATVRIDVEVQPAPTMRLPAESDLGVSDSDRVTSADEITLAGQAQPNQTLHLYAPDGRLLASVVADGNGVWRVDGIPMASLRGDAAGAAAGAPGVYTFTLRPVLADGSDGAALTLGVVREVPPAPIPEPPAPPAEPPAAPASAPAAAGPAQLESNAPAFDSALRPPVQPPADAPPPPPPPAPAPQAPNGNDGDIYTRASGFRIMVTPSNEPSLKLYRGLEDQVVPAGRTLIVQVPADAFIHTQINETITLTARLANGQPLPSWLMFDGKTGKFIGQPPAGQLQDLAIQVTARDSQGRRVDTMFRIKTSEGTIAPSRSPLSLQLMRREALALDRAGQPGRGDNSAAGWKAVNRAAAARG
jgi:VCBS repeat-containing protein